VGQALGQLGVEVNGQRVRFQPWGAALTPRRHSSRKLGGPLQAGYWACGRVGPGWRFHSASAACPRLIASRQWVVRAGGATSKLP